MQHYALDFMPPVLGIDDEFNTIRMGMKWTKLLKPSDIVYIQNSKDKMIIGKAVVTAIESDQLGQICLYHASKNHTELNQDDGHSTSRVYHLMKKMLGPHIVNYAKKATVIYLKRIE
ncbi:hypothetical protein [Acinetobacter brisouii]|uniref:hypothetical protein n=1 Tax=Acinetobacter brisouii TaxID=396323 RepID=UPI00124C786F|nr:hypothetical protein [Acinetobacter brisouii]